MILNIESERKIIKVSEQMEEMVLANGETNVPQDFHTPTQSIRRKSVSEFRKKMKSPSYKKQNHPFMTPDTIVHKRERKIKEIGKYINEKFDVFPRKSIQNRRSSRMKECSPLRHQEKAEEAEENVSKGTDMQF